MVIGSIRGAPHVVPLRIARQHLELVFPCLRLALTLETRHSIVVGLCARLYDGIPRGMPVYVTANPGSVGSPVEHVDYFRPRLHGKIRG